MTPWLVFPVLVFASSIVFHRFKQPTWNRKTDRMLYALDFIDQSLVSHHHVLPEDDWAFVVILEKKRREVIRYLHNVVLTFSDLVHFTDSNSERLYRRCQLTQSTWNRRTDITDEMLSIALIDQFTGLSSWDTPRRWVHYHHLTKIILQFLLVSEERSDCLSLYFQCGGGESLFLK